MLQQLLKQHFNFDSFRPGQEEIISCIVDGHDTLAIMPTGGGKSLCYQLPAVISEKMTIVISPLIALMKDQVDSLKVQGISAEFINSSLTAEQIQDVYTLASSNRLAILYVAPERLQNKDFLNTFAKLPVGFIAVDEAHCVSSWGHDFRPDYMLIKEFIDQFAVRPTVGAFTATATTEVRENIVQQLQLKKPKVFVRGFNRPNLMFSAIKDMGDEDRTTAALKFCQKVEGSGIIYVLTRKKAEAVASTLRQNDIAAVAYHAGLQRDLRNRVQDEFMENRYKVIVATVAFGMGVNKSDIRFVIHLGMPASLENYYQEAGRAGRDGERAKCLLLASKKDNSLHNFFTSLSRKEMMSQGKQLSEIQHIVDIKFAKLECMKMFVEGASCRRKMILEYFSDPEVNNYSDNCNSCDVCLQLVTPSQASAPAKPKPRKKYKQGDQLSDTIDETVKLYKVGHAPEGIAKVRNLGVGTVFNHLIDWYATGGDLNIEKYVSPREEETILSVLANVPDGSPLRDIKGQLPSAISYEQIKMIQTKFQRAATT